MRSLQINENNKMNDIELVCSDCKFPFTWTKGEQKFMSELCENGKLDYTDKLSGETMKGKVTPPKRCPDCRAIHKQKYQDRLAGRNY